MKMSFSLSSLQPSSGSLERAEHARIRVERPYNSLTKKRLVQFCFLVAICVQKKGRKMY